MGLDFGILSSFVLGTVGYLLGIRIAHTAFRKTLWFLLLLVLVALALGNISWQLSQMRSLEAESELLYRHPEFVYWVYWLNLISVLLGVLVVAGVDWERRKIGLIRLTLAAIIGVAALPAFEYAMLWYGADWVRPIVSGSLFSWPFYQSVITIIGVPLAIVAFAIAVVTRSFVGTAVGMCGAIIFSTIRPGGEWAFILLWPAIPFIIIAAWLGYKIGRVFRSSVTVTSKGA